MKIEYGATNDIEEECANFAEAYAAYDSYGIGNGIAIEEEWAHISVEVVL
jgi:hypothetical protein